MKLSDRGIDFLIEREGLETKVYLDSAGLPTIGVGHLLTRDELSSGKICIGGHYIKYRDGLSLGLVRELLRQDTIEAEETVNRFVTVDLTQSQFDALVSFSFNVGAGAFARSTLLRRLNAGEYDAVPGQLRRWVYAGGKSVDGLARRREREVELWTA